jgi:hypothetical protein
LNFERSSLSGEIGVDQEKCRDLDCVFPLWGRLVDLSTDHPGALFIVPGFALSSKTAFQATGADYTGFSGFVKGIWKTNF